MDIAHYFNHPEDLDKETLYELRSLLALYPYYQPARVLLLRNLFLLHNPTFDEELRRAALFITDRHTLFDLVEGPHYRLRTPETKQIDENDGIASPQTPNPAETNRQPEQKDRTTSLIDDFLETLPQKEETPTENKRKPTPADATIDYVAYLLETENKEAESNSPELRGQSLIDDFINKESGRITLQDETEYEAEINEETEDGAEIEDDSYFTETLAKIYIKQQKYSKALEIIKRLNLEYPKKNRYFADQIRFLEKLIINNNKKSE